MSVKAQQVRSKTPGAIRTCVASFVGQLEAGKLLSGTPTAKVLPVDGNLVVDNLARNTTTLTIRRGDDQDNEEDVETALTDQAVTFRVSGGRPGTLYELTIRCATTGSPSQTLEVVCLLEIKRR